MGRHYDFTLTRLARAVADAKYSCAAVERRARLEIDGLGLEDGPAGLILHCFGMPSAEVREFICTPDERGTGFVVDTVSYVEGDVIRSGPLKGRRLKMAVPDSDP